MGVLSGPSNLAALRTDAQSKNFHILKTFRPYWEDYRRSTPGSIGELVGPARKLEKETKNVASKEVITDGGYGHTTCVEGQ